LRRWWNPIMTNLRFIVQTGQILAVTGSPPRRDVPTSEDPLPAVVRISTAGSAAERTKRKTDVKGETLDGK
jgi:hypothetical protein